MNCRPSSEPIPLWPFLCQSGLHDHAETGREAHVCAIRPTCRDENSNPYFSISSGSLTASFATRRSQVRALCRPPTHSLEKREVAASRFVRTTPGERALWLILCPAIHPTCDSRPARCRKHQRNRYGRRRQHSGCSGMIGGNAEVGSRLTSSNRTRESHRSAGAGDFCGRGDTMPPRDAVRF
jgi:hypothetical protein